MVATLLIRGSRLVGTHRSSLGASRTFPCYGIPDAELPRGDALIDQQETERWLKKDIDLKVTQPQRGQSYEC